MKKSISIFLLLFVICSNLNAQDYLRYSKKGAKWELDNWIKKEKIRNCNYVENDSSLTLQLRDTSKAIEDLYLHFNVKGLCNQVILSSYCYNDCLIKDFKVLLKIPKYSWTKVDSLFYISKPSRRITLKAIPAQTDSSGILSLSLYEGTVKEFKLYRKTLLKPKD